MWCGEYPCGIEGRRLFSMVCHLESRRMWVALGNPCESAYEEIDLPELREAA
jgi:hypothetical protein